MLRFVVSERAMPKLPLIRKSVAAKPKSSGSSLLEFFENALETVDTWTAGASSASSSIKAATSHGCSRLSRTAAAVAAADLRSETPLRLRHAFVFFWFAICVDREAIDKRVGSLDAFAF